MLDDVVFFTLARRDGHASHTEGVGKRLNIKDVADVGEGFAPRLFADPMEDLIVARDNRVVVARADVIKVLCVESKQLGNIFM